VRGDTQAMALTPDGRTLHVVGNASDSDQADSQVTPISTATNTAGTPIPDPGSPEAIATAGARCPRR
jgi:hypothetical protein